MDSSLTPIVILSALDKSITTDLKSVNVNDIKKVDNKIVLSCKENNVAKPCTRRVTRSKSLYKTTTTKPYNTRTRRSSVCNTIIGLPFCVVIEPVTTLLAKGQKGQLHLSYGPNALPCRKAEFSNIFNFLKGKLENGCRGFMYLSGVPGTGKTAIVTEVIRNLELSAINNEIPYFKYVNINGMRLSEPGQSYVQIVKQLMGKTLPWEDALAILENNFSILKIATTPVILVVDELDILCTKEQDVVHNLLKWQSKANTQLIVVTIANAMDLIERLLMGRITRRLGITKLTFQPYTYKQLEEIVMNRLTGTNAFNRDAVKLVARKVASASGNVRQALDICRKSVDIAELLGDNKLVSSSHVNQALSAVITQPKVQATERSSESEKLYFIHQYRTFV